VQAPAPWERQPASVMLMAEKGAIREVIPFPKTAKGSELMCDAPAPVPERQLRELGIAVRKTS